MKIALVIENMDPARGGREASTAEIAAGLARRGHQVAVLCQQGRWSGPNVEVLELGRRGLFRSWRVGNFAADVAKAAAEGGFDIIHATLPVPCANVYQPRGGTIPAQAAASARRWGAAGGLRRRAFEPLNLCRRALGRIEDKLARDNSVLCLAVSWVVAQEFAEFYGRQVGVRVVRNGVSLPEIDPEDWAHWRQRIRFDLGVGQRDPVFISVANNFALKGIRETIEAFAKWDDSHQGRANARLVIVGKPQPEGYERIASMRGVGGKVLFVPPTQEIFRWYAAADACVLLSWYDPCSRTVLEATRLGIPSITTVYNGASEILTGGAGIVVGSPEDTRAVVAALDELADPQRRAARAQVCRATADELSMERHVERLLEAYRGARRPA